MLVNLFGNYSLTVYINCTHIHSSEFTALDRPIGSQTWFAIEDHTITWVIEMNSFIVPVEWFSKLTSNYITDYGQRPPYRVTPLVDR